MSTELALDKIYRAVSALREIEPYMQKFGGIIFLVAQDLQQAGEALEAAEVVHVGLDVQEMVGKNVRI